MGSCSSVSKSNAGAGENANNSQTQSANERQNAPESIYRKAFDSAEQYRMALAEKYNGITSTDKIKSAKDISDFLNYNIQSQYYTQQNASGVKKVQSSYSESKYGEIPHAEVVFDDSGTSAIRPPKELARTEAFHSAVSKLKESGINVESWLNDAYLVHKRRGARSKKWIDGAEKFR